MINKSYFGVDFSYSGKKFIVGNTSISVSVSIFHNLVDFSSCEVLSNWRSNSLEVNSIEHSFSGGIKGFVYWLKSSLWGSIFIESEDVKEGSKIDFSLVSRVLDNGKNLRGLFCQVKSLDGIDQLVSWDISTSIVIKNIKNFFEFNNGIAGKAFGDVFGGIESFLLKMEITLVAI